VRERLYRSRSDRMIFGVAGGMADWLDLDPSLVRLVWALLVVAGGVGLLLYIIAAIVIPEEPIGAAVTAAGAVPGAAVDAGPDAAAGMASAAGADATGNDWHARREAHRAARAQRSGNGAMIFGVVLIILGAWFLVDRYLNIDSALLLPGVLIVLGGALVVGAMSRSVNR
jgi:phage shock protein C